MKFKQFSLPEQSSKSQNYQFKLKFGTNNSNIQNSTAMLIFSVFDQKYCFWVNLPRKNLTFVTQTNSNIQKSIVKFIFLFSTRDTLFWQIWSKTGNCEFKLKLGTRLIRVCIIQWQCSFFLFQTGNTLFGQICSKKSKVSV